MKSLSPNPSPAPREPRRRGRHRLPRRSWQCLLHEVLQSWGLTLRLALLLLLLFAAADVVIVAAFGAHGALLVTVLCVALQRMWRQHRPRMNAA